jgi:autotransporter passenger strand-loop-strand repeat protein
MTRWDLPSHSRTRMVPGRRPRRRFKRDAGRTRPWSPIPYLASGGEDVAKRYAGGDEYDEAGGEDVDTIVDSGGTPAVEDGGVAVSATINDGGFEYVYSGGTASDTVVYDPGDDVIYPYAVVDNVTINGRTVELKPGR